MVRCECGMCDHVSDKECIEEECKCCINFHLRSGPKLLHARI
jgi:hypothetical protein